MTDVNGDLSTLRFEHQADASRYALFDGDTLVAVLDYRDDGRTVSMTRTFTVPPFRGHGYAAVVTEGAVADVEERGDRRIIAMCWYVAEWFEKHPERAGILRAA
jgi:predicted GNAT family acetyltransferase